MDDQDAAGPETPVLLDTSEGIATVTLNRTHRRNAVSWQLILDLLATLRTVRDDPAVRVVVLTGAGRDFCVGADLARVGSDRTSDQETRTLRGRSTDDDVERLTHASTVAQLLVDFPKPTIAAVNGACAGAGLSLALATDIRIASERAVFNTAFLGAGVPGDLGSAWLLTRAVGPGRARAMLLDPAKLTATQAADAGLVTQTVPDLRARVTEVATMLATRAPLAVSYAKQNLADAGDCSLAEYLRREIPRMVDCAHSEGAREAARAFVRRRPGASEEDRS